MTEHTSRGSIAQVLAKKDPKQLVMAPPNSFGQLGLSILGVGSQYPPYGLKPDAIDTLAKRYHPESPSMKKVCAINQFTGIDTRSSIGNPDHPVVNHPDPPSIAQLHEVFMNDGVPLAVSAARKAIAEARIDLDQIVSFLLPPPTLEPHCTRCRAEMIILRCFSWHGIQANQNADTCRLDYVYGQW